MPTQPESDDDQQRSEERFQLLVDSVQDYAIFMLDPRGHIVSWNRGAQKIKGWSAEEIIGRSFETFYPQEAIASGWPQEELRRAVRDGRFEDQGWRICKGGRRIWANVVITALKDEKGQLRGFAKVTRDLTETRRQQEELRRSEEQLRLLVESVKDYAIFMLDTEGHIRTWNSGATAIHGYAAHEVLGQHFSMLFTSEDRADGAPAEELRRAQHEGRVVSQGWRVRKSGGMFWADVVVTPVMDENGLLRGYAKVTRDLSQHRRLAELEQASQRMSEFLAMLGHELRNPLAPIRNAASILQLQPDLPERVQRTRDMIARQVSHLTRLVDDLLDVGRIVTGKILLKSEPLDYRDVVQASVEAATPFIEQRRHQLTVSLPDRPLPMVGDSTRLAQVLQNLLHNAARYTPEGGELSLTVAMNGATLMTSVADNGIGLARESLERIFDLFAQGEAARQPNDSGLGIGLSLARTLIEQHGGTVTARSEGLGKGSTFVVRLPLGGVPQQAAQG